MTRATNTITIEDLRQPVLTNAHIRDLKYLEKNPPKLCVDAVLVAARERTGLQDFGAEDFHERLRTWLAAVDADPNRSELGRLMAFRRCVRWATNRLRLQDLISRHPEISETQIIAPIVVVGLPRSGTTHLLNLLATDHRLRSLPLWESYEPIPGPNDTPYEDGFDPRYRRCAHKWRRREELLPLSAAMHRMDPDHITEEIELQGADFSAGWLQYAALVPGWASRYGAEDQTSHYQYMSTVLKALQWQRGPNRWVLKSPCHTEQLGPLITTFPDATIVMTHRDPVAVTQSALTMFAYFARLEFRRVDIDYIANYWVGRIESMIRAIIRDKKLVPEGQIVDVHFHEFMEDAIGTAESVYKAAKLEVSDEQRARMYNFEYEHPRNKDGKIKYDLSADFGIEVSELRERFRFYYQRFPVKIEN